MGDCQIPRAGSGSRFGVRVMGMAFIFLDLRIAMPWWSEDKFSCSVRGSSLDRLAQLDRRNIERFAIFCDRSPRHDNALLTEDFGQLTVG